MMKLLGIDYGTKRIGLAISDESQTFARELVILSPKDFFVQINDLIKNERIERLVVGLPLNMSGEDSDKTREARKFAEQIQVSTGVPVELIDERLSSAMAESAAGTKENIDSLAAQIILQNYLDARHL